MLFDGPLVRKVGSVNVNLITDITEKINSGFSDKWLSRSKLNTGTKVLKIIAPLPNVDLLAPIDQESLRCITQPLLDTIELAPNEKICYADISSLFPKIKVPLHLDYIWLHVLSRRIHIPLMTNEKTKMGFLIERDKVQVEHFEVGNIYEVNNTHPHSAYNGGNTERWHLIVDVIDCDTMKFIADKWMNGAIAPSINYVWGDISYHHINKALEIEV